MYKPICVYRRNGRKICIAWDMREGPRKKKEKKKGYHNLFFDGSSSAFGTRLRDPRYGWKDRNKSGERKMRSPGKTEKLYLFRLLRPLFFLVPTEQPSLIRRSRTLLAPAFPDPCFLALARPLRLARTLISTTISSRRRRRGRRRGSLAWPRRHRPTRQCPPGNGSAPCPPPAVLSTSMSHIR